jgi:membrane peptidoglycan carboxypeptidase
VPGLVAETLRVPDTRDYSPLPVHTTYDPKLQRLAEEAVETVLNEQGKKREAGQAAMVIMRTDGRVLAMVGGRNHADSQFNRAVQALRQPGSAFKLFVYLAALRGGLKTCPFRKVHPARIRIIRQNHRIYVCDPARARNARRRPIQVAVPA